MNKTLLIIIIVVVGGAVVAFRAAPSNDALNTPLTSGGLSSQNDDAVADDSGVQDQGSEGGSEPQVGINVGDLAADFTLESFDGESVTLSSFRGQAVLIDFWAGWCPFCVRELPELEAAHQQYGDGDLVILGIHRTRTESVETGAGFASERGVTYTLLKDSDDSVYRFYSGGQNFMPVAYFIDKNGVIQDRMLGPKSTEQIESKVQALLAE